MLTIKANAKINLCLYIIERRNDGFHNIFSVMQKIDFADTLHLEKGNDYSLEIEGVKIPGENIIEKAYRQIMKYKGSNLPISIKLLKKIPIGAGLGGGSSDAAAFLRGINQLYELGLDRMELIKIASTVGSDVPFFLTDGSAIVTGRGEIIEPIELPIDYSVLLVCPKFSINTGWAYSQIRNYLTPPEKVLKLIKSNACELWNVLPEFSNGFTETVFGLYPELRSQFKVMYETGADFVSFSGSGSAFFGIFRDHKSAKKAAKLNWNGQVVLAKPLKTRFPG